MSAVYTAAGANIFSNTSVLSPITPNASCDVRPRNSSSPVIPFIVSAYAKYRSCLDPLISRFRTTSSLRIASTFFYICKILPSAAFEVKRKEKLTSSCLAFSAGGKYGGSGALRRNADASVEKYNIMLPTISRRSLVTGTMKSRRTLYTIRTLISTTRHTRHTSIQSYRVPVKATLGATDILEARGLRTIPRAW